MKQFLNKIDFRQFQVPFFCLFFWLISDVCLSQNNSLGFTYSPDYTYKLVHADTPLTAGDLPSTITYFAGTLNIRYNVNNNNGRTGRVSARLTSTLPPGTMFRIKAETWEESHYDSFYNYYYSRAYSNNYQVLTSANVEILNGVGSNYNITFDSIVYYEISVSDITKLTPTSGSKTINLTYTLSSPN